MDYSTIARISASGMSFQKARVEAATLNLANIGTVADASGRLYQPLTVVAQGVRNSFAGSYSTLKSTLLGVSAAQVMPSDRPGVRSYEPGHPLADKDGYVSHPDIDHLTEMMTINSAVRAYEANVAAVQSARAMCTKALEIGGNS